MTFTRECALRNPGPCALLCEMRSNLVRPLTSLSRFYGVEHHAQQGWQGEVMPDMANLWSAVRGISQSALAEVIYISGNSNAALVC